MIKKKEQPVCHLCRTPILVGQPSIVHYFCSNDCQVDYLLAARAKAQNNQHRKSKPHAWKIVN